MNKFFFYPGDIAMSSKSLSTGNIVFIILVGLALLGVTIYMIALDRKRRKK